MAAVVAICAGCSREFVPSRPNQRYHAETCRGAARQRRHRERERSRHLATSWPPRFDRAEEALVEQIRQRVAEPSTALLRIVDAWRVAA